MNNKTLVCVPIMQEEPHKILLSAEKAIRGGADLVEIRFDVISDPDTEMVKELVENIKHPFIATNRMVEEGGFFLGSEKERIKILYSAAPYAEYVDIELFTSEKFRNKVVEASKSSIISFHDFEKTPKKDKIIGIVENSKEIGDIAKFSVMPHNMKDTLTVLEVLSEYQNVIGISMGKFGTYTRVVAPLFGSPLTYASLDQESAPGQLDLITTKNLLQNLKG